MNEIYLPEAATEPGDDWGYELVLDCSGADIQAVTSPDTIKAFLKALVKKIDMEAYGEPLLHHFGEHDPKLAGWTAIQLITTSSISIHFCDNGNIFMNLFSCKHYDQEVAIDVVKEYFKPTKLRPRFSDRSIVR
jgi:S-adenosylmethionine/arginine decarboxylase-like enzyme